MAAKKSAIVQQTNDENALPEHYAASVATGKQDPKIPVDQFKAFTVFEEEQPAVDENVPPMKCVSVEVDSSTMSTSYTTVRYLSTMMIRYYYFFHILLAILTFHSKRCNFLGTYNNAMLLGGTDLYPASL